MSLTPRGIVVAYWQQAKHQNEDQKASNTMLTKNGLMNRVFGFSCLRNP